jgi:CheY-like chemotaxis protein
MLGYTFVKESCSLDIPTIQYCHAQEVYMNTSLENKTILVVDDDADTCEAARSALEEAGGSVILAHSVDCAFETYRQAPPHAVIADIRLGRSDGYALIKAIRQTDSEYRGFTPVIAMTSFSRRRSKSAGCRI